VLTRLTAPDPIRFAVSDRYGGVSGGPYESLNLGAHVGDEDTAVEENRRRLAEDLGGGAPAWMHQVHGDTVTVVAGPRAGAADPADRPGGCDGQVTTRPGTVLAVLVADCVPVLLGSAAAPAVGVAHAGRRGLVAGVVARTVAALGDLGAEPGGVVAWVGPAVCGGCYEVPAALQEEVVAVVPAARATTRSGTPGLDLRAGVVAELRASGVRAVETDPRCTLESPELYSYRRDRVTGRFAGLAWLAG
jgi:YfiH family protein